MAIAVRVFEGILPVEILYGEKWLAKSGYVKLGLLRQQKEFSLQPFNQTKNIPWFKSRSFYVLLHLLWNFYFTP